jgi:hypothetical protein
MNARDRIKAAKAELAAAEQARDDERAEAFNLFLIKRFGRLPKRGDIIVPASGYDSVREPVQVVKITWNTHPCILVKEARVDQMGSKIEFTPIKMKDGFMYAGDFVFRTALLAARFARPDEKDGSAYEFIIDYNDKRRYPTYPAVLESLKSRFKVSDFEMLTKPLWGKLSLRRPGENQVYMIQRVRKDDHPFHR